MVAGEYSQQMIGQEFVPALRGFVQSLPLAGGEAQKIDCYVKAFAQEYTRRNPTKFAKSDVFFSNITKGDTQVTLEVSKPGLLVDLNHLLKGGSFGSLKRSGLAGEDVVQPVIKTTTGKLPSQLLRPLQIAWFRLVE